MRSTYVSGDRSSPPVQQSGLKPQVRELTGSRERGLEAVRPLTARELVMISLEQKLRELRARLDEFEREKEEAKRYRPRVAGEIRVVSRQELASFPTYSR